MADDDFEYEEVIEDDDFDQDNLPDEGDESDEFEEGDFDGIDLSDKLDALVNSIGMEDFAAANASFTDILNDKISASLDQKKLALADSMFNDASGEEFDDDEFDFSEEELDLSDIDDEDLLFDDDEVDSGDEEES